MGEIVNPNRLDVIIFQTSSAVTAHIVSSSPVFTTVPCRVIRPDLESVRDWAAVLNCVLPRSS